MAKRFTDTNKWRKPFIRGLQGAYKLLWFYILDDCDHAGIWIVDMEVAEIRIGEPMDIEKAIQLFSDKIYIFDNGERWFISDFIEFQYGVLSETNRAHNSVINILMKYELINKNKELISTLQGAKDKDKDKEEDKDKEINIEFSEFWDLYDKKTGDKKKIEKGWNKLKDKERELIIVHVKEYVASTPDKQFRKNPETYLNQSGWEHEIIKIVRAGDNQPSKYYNPNSSKFPE